MCNNVKVDLGFIVDSSESIGRRNWAKLKTFVKTIISSFEVAPGKTHVSAIAYSSKAKEVFRFNTLRNSDLNTDEVDNLIDGMKWERGFTRTDLALLLSDSNMFTSSAGMRNNVPKVLKHY